MKLLKIMRWAFLVWTAAFIVIFTAELVCGSSSSNVHACGLIIQVLAFVLIKWPTDGTFVAEIKDAKW